MLQLKRGGLPTVCFCFYTIKQPGDTNNKIGCAAVPVAPCNWHHIVSAKISKDLFDALFYFGLGSHRIT